MVKKDYLTRTEQDIWGYIKDKEIIDNEIVKQIFPELPEGKRNKILHSLYKKGYLNRARKDLYFNPEQIGNFYKLALRIHDGYISLNSALRHYNLTEYEDFTIFVMTKDYQKKVDLKGTQYDVYFIPLKNLFTGFEKKGDMYLPSIEKALFDCFLKPKFTGFTNITKALYDAKIDWNKFIYFFKLTKNHSLHQRAGYILEMMRNKTNMKVPSFALRFLQKQVKGPAKLIPKGGNSTFSKKWKIQDNLGEKNILSWWH